MQDLEYGIIGNCATAALVHCDSSIDWLCFPRFDSPSVFARILDENKGGYFKITPNGKFETSQEYVKDSNVIVTHFTSDEWAFDLYDYFPHYDTHGQLYKDPEMHRLIKVVKGKPRIITTIKPMLQYATIEPKISIEKNSINFSDSSGRECIYLYSNLPLEKIMNAEELVLDKDSYFVITYNKIKPEIDVEAVKLTMDKTINYWKGWISKAKLPKEYRDLIARSALALRLLTYDETGAIIAAATTSIPEIVGDVRNWDYRYCWIRDSSFTVMSLINISRFDVAHEFMKWALAIHRKYGINLQVLFGVNGERDIPERTLDNLSGYKGSRPVRVGNAAATQRQVDIFGELLDAIYLFYVKHKKDFNLDESDWELIYGLVESAIKEWRYKDHSIWEFRTISKHYTFSKVLCWVALDRGVEIAKALGKDKYSKRWAKIRDEIKSEIMANGWNANVGSFTQSYGSDELDASLLLLPYFGFIDYKDEKMAKTVEAIGNGLFKNGFVMRYNAKDDFGMPKNALIACTFWYIDALYEIGKKEEAIKLFVKTVAHANKLGLLSEDINRETGELLGNFPQAYSHIALINTAMHLFK
ncbi:MAG: glycoside hydrolase family 15 protein [Methanothrix sp.]